MKINITVKQINKKYPKLTTLSLDLPVVKGLVSLRDLLLSIVEINVNAYNSRNIEPEDSGTASPPLSEDLAFLIETGNAGFGNIYNEKKANLGKALENVIQAYEDGLFTVFYGDEEITSLDEFIALKEEKNLVFIRLTFLSGTFF